MTSTELPQENVPKGALLALLALPVGAVAIGIVLSLGYFAAIISFGAAFLAYFLYKKGAGQPSVTGAIIVGVITLVTALVGWVGYFLFAAVSEGYPASLGLEVAFSPLVAGDFWLNLLFAALGGGAVVFTAIREANAAKAETAQAAWTATPGAVPPPAAGAVTPPPYTAPTEDPNAPKA